MSLIKNSVIFQILHIVFALLAIISWFDELYYFALDINFSFVQQNVIRQDFIHWFFMPIADFSSTYIVYIIVLALGYFAMLILPSITLTLAAMALCKRRRLIQVSKLSEKKLDPCGENMHIEKKVYCEAMAIKTNRLASENSKIFYLYEQELVTSASELQIWRFFSGE